MRAQASQYLNEIISLTIMLLLGLALVAGQAEALMPAETAAADSHILAIDIDVSFRHKGE
ncbi:MAG: hypothetical protein OER97_00810 [Gammaproteobacteria bacterium]|nr:hypothetical protein [Gammaproteobacteria bacterium]